MSNNPMLARALDFINHELFKSNPKWWPKIKQSVPFHFFLEFIIWPDGIYLSSSVIMNKQNVLVKEAGGFYAEHAERPFYNDLKSFVSGPNEYQY
jgi:hypothetical protein